MLSAMACLFLFVFHFLWFLITPPDPSPGSPFAHKAFHTLRRCRGWVPILVPNLLESGTQTQTETDTETATESETETETKLSWAALQLGNFIELKIYRMAKKTIHYMLSHGHFPSDSDSDSGFEPSKAFAFQIIAAAFCMHSRWQLPASPAHPQAPRPPSSLSPLFAPSFGALSRTSASLDGP